MTDKPFADRVSTVATLADPIRRALYELVARSPSPVGRDAAATTLDLPRSTAAFHLDRLADEGLLEVSFERLTGRSGPGAGRPAKLYRRPSDEIAVSVPERHYELVARVLAAAVEASAQSGEPVADAVAGMSYEAGRALATDDGSLEQQLERQGFQPQADGVGGLLLGNCPFHQLARQFTPLVCGLNLRLLEGLAAGAGDTRHRMVLDPAPGRCCVRAVPVEPPSRPAGRRGVRRSARR